MDLRKGSHVCGEEPDIRENKENKKKGILPSAGGWPRCLSMLLLALYPAGQAQAATTVINVCSHQGDYYYNILGNGTVDLRAKLDNPANFGPAGIIAISISITLTWATTLNRRFSTIRAISGSRATVRSRLRQQID